MHTGNYGSQKAGEQRFWGQPGLEGTTLWKTKASKQKALIFKAKSNYHIMKESLSASPFQRALEKESTMFIML